ncbi:MAG: amidase family protein [Microgenomates group bacterium]
MKPRSMTLRSAQKQLREKTISHSEILNDIYSSIGEQNKQLNVLLTIQDKDKSLKKSEELAGRDLAGLPIAVKDNFCTLNMQTTASSEVLKDFKPQFESTVTKKLVKFGGLIIGKANLDAWAHGSSTETSQFGRTLNPRNPDHLPGGSSGGSAAAVASDMCLAALGTETAGSIRQPAAWCGVVGLKPTYGRCSRYGIAAMASSTDSPGPITKTVEDAAIVLNAIAGPDKYDATTTQKPAPDFTESIGKSIKNMKIGYVYHDLKGLEETSKLFEPQLKVFEELGAHVEKVDALDPNYAVGSYTVFQRGEVSSNLARYDGIRYGKDRSFFGDEAKRRIMLGTYTLSEGFTGKYYSLAQKVRTLYIQNFEKLFEKYDVLVSLSSPGFAKKIGATDGEAMFGELEDMLLEPSSISGLPGISVPCYRDPKTNLYLGLNIVAPQWREDLVLQAGHAFEQATKWNSWLND